MVSLCEESSKKNTVQSLPSTGLPNEKHWSHSKARHRLQKFTNEDGAVGRQSPNRGCDRPGFPLDQLLRIHLLQIHGKGGSLRRCVVYRSQTEFPQGRLEWSCSGPIRSPVALDVLGQRDDSAVRLIHADEATCCCLYCSKATRLRSRHFRRARPMNRGGLGGEGLGRALFHHIRVQRSR